MKVLDKYRHLELMRFTKSLSGCLWSAEGGAASAKEEEGEEVKVFLKDTCVVHMEEKKDKNTLCCVSNSSSYSPPDSPRLVVQSQW